MGRRHELGLELPAKPTQEASLGWGQWWGELGAGLPPLSEGSRYTQTDKRCETCTSTSQIHDNKRTIKMRANTSSCKDL